MAAAVSTIAGTWHHHYDDPDGDVILVSKDRFKFSTTSRILAKASAVFESMKEIPAPVGDESTSPSTIQIDHPAAIIEIFLDLASVSQPNLAPIYLAQCRDLLVFVEQFDCRVLTHKVRLRLCELVESAEDCAEVFVAASDRDDWVMGRAALGRVRSSVVYHIRARSVTGIKTYFDRLRPSWRQKMVELVLFPLAQGTAKSYDWDWSLYAPDFQRPATPPEKRKRSDSDGATTP